MPEILAPQSSSILIVAGLILGPPGIAHATEPTCLGQQATNPGSLIGTEGDDVIIGTDANDTIVGLGGNDLICGLGGDDVLSGGAGTTLLTAAEGTIASPETPAPPLRSPTSPTTVVTTFSAVAHVTTGSPVITFA
jgi:hypothetical protein